MLCIPISCSEFYGEYFEKQCFYAPKVADIGIFTWDDLNDVLFTLEPEKHEDVKVLLEGRVPVGGYASSYQDLDKFRQRIMPEKLNALLRSGATLIINRLDLKSRKIACACQRVSDLYELKTVANGYLALGGKGTFGKHWDTHDVFALQLFGRKRWRIFRPTLYLPLEHQTSASVKDTCPKVPMFDRVLQAGDLLYIPRGWWHEAIPLENEPTFHLAIGAHTAKLIDYLVWVSENYLALKEIARTSTLDEPVDGASLGRFAQVVAAILSDSDVYSRFRREVEGMRNSYVPFDLESMVGPIPLNNLSAGTKQ
ncbi:MAG: hypothetical protein EPN57_13925 [Paraburkholderia sp.]|nr:MAG: hypothetical protein EPN57_13925 [Paraburkholderia sp.]